MSLLSTSSLLSIFKARLRSVAAIPVSGLNKVGLICFILSDASSKIGGVLLSTFTFCDLGTEVFLLISNALVA